MTAFELTLPLKGITSQQLFRLAEFFSHEQDICLLHSGGTHDLSRKSFLGVIATKTIEITQDAPYPWDELSRRLNFPSDCKRDDPLWLGFLGYPMGQSSDRGKIIPMAHTEFPIAFFQQYQFVFVLNHRESLLKCYQKSSQGDPYWRNKIVEKKFWTEILNTVGKRDFPLVSSMQMGENKQVYREKIREIQNLIRHGEIYQLNYSHGFIFKSAGLPFALFAQIDALNPAPFSGYMKTKNFTIICSSPELFLQKKKNLIETRPIKGTKNRGKTPEEDQKNYRDLLSSQKERAELTMITDLMRNDLSKFSHVGSVRVLDRSLIEKYANVYHQLSIVQSQCDLLAHPITLIRECFPGGSITGCPKLRAMEWINAFEGVSRDIYTGSIGIFFTNGDFVFNIAIRTLLWFQGIFTTRFGGAITIDSCPEMEYEETLHKGQTILNVLKGA